MSADNLLNANVLEGLDVNIILDKVDEDNLEDKDEQGSPTRIHTYNVIHPLSITFLPAVWSSTTEPLIGQGWHLLPMMNEKGKKMGD